MALTDGRVVRGARNKEAIADALLACYEAGILRPSAAEVAERAGVSVRSVHNHFEDMEALREATAARQWQRFADVVTLPPDGASLSERVDVVVEGRAALWEGVTPTRRAALLHVHDSPLISSTFARIDRKLRRAVEISFAPELEDEPSELLDALDAALSWDNWNRLRVAQGCSVARARRILTFTVHALIAGRHS
jgi:AcrR family transcriptional regulator